MSKLLVATYLGTVDRMLAILTPCKVENGRRIVVLGRVDYLDMFKLAREQYLAVSTSRGCASSRRDLYTVPSEPVLRRAKGKRTPPPTVQCVAAVPYTERALDSDLACYARLKPVRSNESRVEVADQVDEVRGIVEALRRTFGMPTPNVGRALKGRRAELVQALREHGQPMHGRALTDKAFGPECTVPKALLAEMVREGTLMRDSAGYRSAK